MLLVIDSKKFRGLIEDIECLQEYKDANNEYDAGMRDGYNQAVIQIVDKLRGFWQDATS